MSTNEMEAMDNEVMGVVNGHAAPEAAAAAEDIAERVTAPKEETDACQDQSDPIKFDGYSYRMKKETFDKLQEDVNTHIRRKTLTTVILCALLAAALLVVLAVPKLLIWLVNIGVASCAVIAGIAIDRRRR